jgi:demethoxyubiquinone hydroxylase (CLK1/Coq7/Cat5 family)
VLRVDRAAELGMKDIAEGRYTEFRNRDELRAFIERISRRVARRHRAKRKG